MTKDRRFHLARIDSDLVRSARHFIDGANVHTVKTLIYAYENAVLLHNENPDKYFNSYVAYEEKLREFVLQAKRMQHESQLKVSVSPSSAKL